MRRRLPLSRTALAINAAAIAVLAVRASATDNAVASRLTPQDAGTPDSVMRPLAFLAGLWGIQPGSLVLEQNAALRDVIIAEYTWVVGQKAFRYREHVPQGRPDEAELEGMIYWDPATEKIRFTAVAGKGEGQGRLFIGEYTPLADGRIERIYDVFYRTLADTPGESLGGARRRFREVLDGATPDRLTFSLEWWHEGRWQPWARGRYELVRKR